MSDVWKVGGGGWGLCCWGSHVSTGYWGIPCPCKIRSGVLCLMSREGGTRAGVGGGWILYSEVQCNMDKGGQPHTLPSRKKLHCNFNFGKL